MSSGRRAGWLVRFFQTINVVASREEVAGRLAKVEKAIELENIGLAQAEVDLKAAEAIQGLIKSLEGIECAAIQVHSLLVVKLTSDGRPRLVARTLTTDQLIKLEKHPEELRSGQTASLGGQ